MPGLPGTRPAPDLPPGPRLALVVATTAYTDPRLRQLRAPARDAADLADVLADPGIGGFTVTSVIDQQAHLIRLAIEDFLTDRGTQDLLLVYLSCHGLLDAHRRLYFAATDTRQDRLGATAVEAAWILDQLEHCRARRQILILDACFSGAFARGAKGSGDLQLRDRFLGQGRGRVVLTASTATEYSFEAGSEGEPADTANRSGSVFTTALIDGLRSGDADTDHDGRITVDDAYRYVFDQVQARGTAQTPQRWLYGAEGSIVLARNPAGATIVPEALPEALRISLDSPYPSVRVAAVTELGAWLTSGEPARELSAYQHLHQVADTDIPHVAATARRLLVAHQASTPQATDHPSFGQTHPPSGTSLTQPDTRIPPPTSSQIPPTAANDMPAPQPPLAIRPQLLQPEPAEVQPPHQRQPFEPLTGGQDKDVRPEPPQEPAALPRRVDQPTVPRRTGIPGDTTSSSSGSDVGISAARAATDSQRTDTRHPPYGTQPSHATVSGPSLKHPARLGYWQTMLVARGYLLLADARTWLVTAVAIFALVVGGGLFLGYQVATSGYYVAAGKTGADKNLVVIYQGNPNGRVLGINLSTKATKQPAPIRIPDLPTEAQSRVNNTFQAGDTSDAALAKAEQLRSQLCKYELKQMSATDPTIAIFRGEGQSGCPQFNPDKGATPVKVGELKHDDQSKYQQGVSALNGDDAKAQLAALVLEADACKRTPGLDGCPGQGTNPVR